MNTLLMGLALMMAPLVAQAAEPRQEAQGYAQEQTEAIPAPRRTRAEIMQMFHGASFMRDFLDDGDKLITEGKEPSVPSQGDAQ